MQYNSWIKNAILSFGEILIWNVYIYLSQLELWLAQTP